MSVRAANGEIEIEGDAASFKELARLCLLLGGTQTSDESFELKPGVHVERASPVLRLKLRDDDQES